MHACAYIIIGVRGGVVGLFDEDACAEGDGVRDGNCGDCEGDGGVDDGGVSLFAACKAMLKSAAKSADFLLVIIYDILVLVVNVLFL